MSKRIYQGIGPVLVCSIILVVLLIGSFSGVATTEMASVKSGLLKWAAVLAAFAAVYGYATLVMSNLRNISRKSSTDRGKSFYVSVLIVGIIFGWLALILVIPDGYTGDTYKTLALYLGFCGAGFSVSWVTHSVSAYRFLRPRTFNSILFFVAFTFTYLRDLTLWTTIFPDIIPIANWFMGSPGVAVQRATLICAAIGSIVLAIRVIFMREPGVIDYELEAAK